MKIVLSSIIVVTLLLAVGCKKQAREQLGEGELAGTITMSGAWALYPMAVKWAEEFQELHPRVRIDVAAGGAGKGMADALAQVADIGNVSRDIYPEEIKKGAWWVSVTKDAVVPTVNERNPMLAKLLTKGVDRETFIAIWITGTVENWSEVIGEAVTEPIHVYTRSDACGAAKTWAKFLDGKQEDLLGVGVYGDPGLAEAVRNDILGIGFNNINYAYDAKSKAQVEGIKVLPVDLNGNGQIDSEEDFYDSRHEIVAAIATGRYPSPPARDLHFVCQGRPTRVVVTKFIEWVLTDGQKYVPESGYISLTAEKLHEGLKKLEGE
ncbi:MAG: PstS family phosphate ABC transporter substrate-binding protein [Candidatus Neomarinimicrobiota bacterium]